MIYEQGERFLNQVPPFLAYNVISALHDPLSMGLNVVMLPTYEPDKFADNLYKLKINHAIAGPADLRSFDNEQLLEKLDFSNLKTIACGSDKLDYGKKCRLNEIIKE